jgi:DNA-binding NarL/FixJ family response regulator
MVAGSSGPITVPRDPKAAGPGDLLAAEPAIEMVGEAGTAESAVSMIRALWADMAVLDVRPPIRTLARRSARRRPIRGPVSAVIRHQAAKAAFPCR